MTCNGEITVYHCDEENGTYARYYFPEVFIGYTGKLISEKGGVSSGDIARIRIPTPDDISFGKGDYVFFGKSLSEKPEKEKCLRIAAVRDNRFGANPHWRLDLE